jgi:nucleolar protein 58
MLVLFETPAGYALFKVLDEGKLTEVDDIFKQFESPDKASKFVKLKAFSQFADTATATCCEGAISEGVVCWLCVVQCWVGGWVGTNYNWVC